MNGEPPLQSGLSPVGPLAELDRGSGPLRAGPLAFVVRWLLGFLPEGTDPGAVKSISLGMLGLFVMPVGLPIGAFAQGFGARRRIKDGRSRGGWAAITGMVLGVLGMGEIIAIAFVFIALSVCGLGNNPSPDSPQWCSTFPADNGLWVVLGAIWLGQVLLAMAMGTWMARRTSKREQAIPL